MMDNPKAEEPTKPKKELDLDDILRRVDSFPILDLNSPDEIVGYDENGLPTGMGHAKWPDFEARAKKMLGDRVLDDFLNCRHREWEENLCGGSEREPGREGEDPIIGKK